MRLPQNLPWKSWYKAIEVRTSRRKYRSQPLSREEISSLEDQIKPLQKKLSSSRIVISPSGFDDIIWTVIGSYGLITGAESYAVIIKDTDHGQFKADVQTGMLGEALILAATAEEIDTCWVGGMFDEEEVLSNHELKDSEEIAAITPLGQARDRLTLTEKLAKKFAGSHKRKPLAELCRGSPDADELEDMPDWIREAVISARLAPSAVNRQPWMFELKPAAGKVILREAELEDDHGVSPTLDCGIALLHILLGARASLSKQAKQREVTFELLNPPAIAEIYPGGQS